MPYSPAASVAGVSLRVTKLDAAGNLLNGPTDSYLTTAFIRVSFTPEYEEGDEITEKAADGTVCVSFKAPDTLKRVNLEIAVCDPDPELSALMSGGLILSAPNKAGSGDVTKGWASAQVGEDPSGNGVAVETWSKAIDNGKEVGFFHWVFPYVKTRLSGDRVVENGLMATTFEGFGLGNIMFRNGPDGSWDWPAATDRPYLYARSADAPTGLRGFFQYDVTKVTQMSDPAAPPIATPPTFTNITGTNVQGSGNPYPYDPAQAVDNVLSASDYLPDASGTAAWEASADSQSVKNVPPKSGDKDFANQVQNPVTYEDRGAVGTGSPTPAGAPLVVSTVNIGYPGSFTPFGSTVPQTLAALKSDPNVGTTPYSGNAWQPAQSVVLGNGSSAHWDGSEWVVGAAPAPKGGSLPLNAIKVLDDAVKNATAGSEAADLLAALNGGTGVSPTPLFEGAPKTAWTTAGDKFTVGIYEFHWAGTKWAAGAVPTP